MSIAFSQDSSFSNNDENFAHRFDNGLTYESPDPKDYWRFTEPTNTNDSPEWAETQARPGMEDSLRFNINTPRSREPSQQFRLPLALAVLLCSLALILGIMHTKECLSLLCQLDVFTKIGGWNVCPITVYMESRPYTVMYSARALLCVIAVLGPGRSAINHVLSMRCTLLDLDVLWQRWTLTATAVCAWILLSYCAWFYLQTLYSTSTLWIGLPPAMGCLENLCWMYFVVGSFSVTMAFSPDDVPKEESGSLRRARLVLCVLATTYVLNTTCAYAFSPELLALALRELAQSKKLVVYGLSVFLPGSVLYFVLCIFHESLYIRQATGLLTFQMHSHLLQLPFKYMAQGDFLRLLLLGCGLVALDWAASIEDQKSESSLQPAHINLPDLFEAILAVAVSCYYWYLIIATREKIFYWSKITRAILAACALRCFVQVMALLQIADTSNWKFPASLQLCSMFFTVTQTFFLCFRKDGGVLLRFSGKFRMAECCFVLNLAWVIFAVTDQATVLDAISKDPSGAPVSVAAAAYLSMFWCVLLHQGLTLALLPITSAHTASETSPTSHRSMSPANTSTTGNLQSQRLLVSDSAPERVEVAPAYFAVGLIGIIVASVALLTDELTPVLGVSFLVEVNPSVWQGTYCIATTITVVWCCGTAFRELQVHGQFEDLSIAETALPLQPSCTANPWRNYPPIITAVCGWFTCAFLAVTSVQGIQASTSYTEGLVAALGIITQAAWMYFIFKCLAIIMDPVSLTHPNSKKAVRFIQAVCCWHFARLMFWLCYQKVSLPAFATGANQSALLFISLVVIPWHMLFFLIVPSRIAKPVRLAHPLLAGDARPILHARGPPYLLLPLREANCDFFLKMTSGGCFVLGALLIAYNGRPNFAIPPMLQLTFYAFFTAAYLAVWIDRSGERVFCWSLSTKALLLSICASCVATNVRLVTCPHDLDCGWSKDICASIFVAARIGRLVFITVQAFVLSYRVPRSDRMPTVKPSLGFFGHLRHNFAIAIYVLNVILLFHGTTEKGDCLGMGLDTEGFSLERLYFALVWNVPLQHGMTLSMVSDHVWRVTNIFPSARLDDASPRGW